MKLDCEKCHERGWASPETCRICKAEQKEKELKELAKGGKEQ